MTTLEKIRAEIEDKRNVAGHFDTKTARAQVLALSWVLDIIDKYAEQSGWEEMTVPCENCGKDMTFKIAVCGEPTSPCDLCRFDYMDGYCGDCPAMAKAEWEREGGE